MARNHPINLDAVLTRIQAQGADTLLTRSEAVALVAARTMGRHDTARIARNRVAMQMKRAAATGDDVLAGGLAPTENGSLTADELARWASRNYPGLFTDLPTKGRTTHAKLQSGLALSGASDARVLPGSLEVCHAQILAFVAEKKAQEAEMLRAAEERRRELVARFNGKKK